MLYRSKETEIGFGLVGSEKRRGEEDLWWMRRASERRRPLAPSASFALPPSLARSVGRSRHLEQRGRGEEANYGHLNGRIGRTGAAGDTDGQDGPAHSESVKGEWAGRQTEIHRTGGQVRCPNSRESMARLRFLSECVSKYQMRRSKREMST